MFPLIAENLVVEFQGKHILGPINLQIDKGDIAVILGPNGSGKTSLLKALHGILKLKMGTLKWSCLKTESIGKQMFVFQTPIMLRRSVFENLTYPLLLRKTPKAQANHRAEQWLDRIDLRALMQVPATRLSGGEKQRLSIARAILKESPIILLDEATSSLDAESEEVVQNAILNLTKNKTTLVIAHRLSTIHNAQIIFVLKNGEIINSGSHEYLINECEEYKSLYSKQLK